ncbi:MAG: DUF1858 domain-containing protein [Ardenticatenaceae bacterium]|nr:DUF1858 domain-containing protein [Ardenticatenaceae bacterium]
MLEYVSMALSLGAFAWGWSNHRARRNVEHRLDTMRSSHFRLAEEARREIATLQQQVKDLKLELRRQTGGLKFEPTMTVGEAYEIHPHAQDVFTSFHLGGCSSCAVSPDETIESVAINHGVDLNKLLTTLNTLLDAEKGSTVLQQLQRQPNVSIQF